MSESKDDDEVRNEEKIDNGPLKEDDPRIKELRKYFDAYTIHDELDDMDKVLDAREKKDLISKAKELGISETETLNIINQWMEETGSGDESSGPAASNLAPSIKHFKPEICAAGEEVTITGRNLSEATFVSFGGTEASKFTVDSSTQITAIVGSGSPGAVEVRARIGKAFSTGFKFIKPPVINKFTPDSTKSGTDITIKGKNFTGTNSVSFGGTAATKFNVDSDNQITAVVGQGSSGAVEVRTGEGKATVQGFKYIRLPAITKFTPDSAKSGAEVTINGSNFTGTTTVTFGGTDALSFTVDSNTTITAIIGSGSSGSIEVRTTDGMASISGFRLIAPPVVNGFSPVNAALGDTVTVTGRNFTGASAVSFGGKSVSKFTVDSDSQITAIVGLGSHGSVEVNNQEGKSSQPGFKFMGPVINSFSPDNARDGDTVTITGINFTGANIISFGGIVVSKFNVNSDTRITAIIGAGNTGHVEVKTRDGKASLPGFKFVGPVLNGLSPTAAKLGDTVTIKGMNLTGTSVVSFGGADASKFTVDSDTRITAIIGTGNTGHVEVKTRDGKASLSGFKFYGPVINDFSPTTTKRGDTVTIIGANLADVTTVSFGGTAATKFTVDSDKQISATVGYGSSGSISVDTSFGTAIQNGFIYRTKVPFITACVLSILMFLVWYSYGLLKPELSVAWIAIFTLIPVWIYIIDKYALKQFLNRLKSPYLYIVPIALFLAFSLVLNDYLFTKSVLFHKPTIDDFSPKKGGAGKQVIITGNYLSGITAVKFGGTEARDIKVDSDTQITAIVGEGSNGKVSVEALGGKEKSHDEFTYIPKPIIIRFKPQKAKKGVEVIIQGEHFADVDIVTLGGEKAKISDINSDGTQISVFVGKGRTGDVTVTTQGGRGSKEGFTYIPPRPDITSFSPGLAGTDGKIEIQGEHFIKDGTTVKFGGIEAKESNVISDTQIIAIVGDGSTGFVSVNTPGGDDVSKEKFTFLPKPIIFSFNPQDARAGETLVIEGEHFEDVTKVTLGGEEAIISHRKEDGTQITIVVGSGNDGYIEMTTPGGTKSSKNPFKYIPPKPIISYFLPLKARIGEKVTIKGEYFKNVESVTLGTTTAEVLKDKSNDTQITVVVGDRSSGNVKVITPGGTATSGELFTFVGGHYEYIKKRNWVDTSRKERVWVAERHEGNRRIEGHYEERNVPSGYWQEYEEETWVPERQIPKTWEDVKVQIEAE